MVIGLILTLSGAVYLGEQRWIQSALESGRLEPIRPLTPLEYEAAKQVLPRPWSAFWSLEKRALARRLRETDHPGEAQKAFRLFRLIACGLVVVGLLLIAISL
jgi:hypothetical protein